MKKQFIVANWKSHKNTQETTDWFENFPRFIGSVPPNKAIVVCPPFALLPIAKDLVTRYSPDIIIGSQDISSFEEGAYTGEVSGKLIKDFAQYVIIGHSERRQYFHETDEILQKKVLQAKAHLLKIIYCVSQKEQNIPEGVDIVAFEPLDAIGTGHPEDPEQVEETARFIKEKNSVSYMLYGGSSAPENVSHYTSLPSIDGVLVGGASLDPQEFAQLIQHA